MRFGLQLAVYFVAALAVGILVSQTLTLNGWLGGGGGEVQRRNYEPPNVNLTALPIMGSLVDIMAFHGYMQNASTYLEYGAGGSTTMAGLLIGDMTYTVESLPSWCEGVQTHQIMADRLEANRSKFMCVESPYQTGSFGFAKRKKKANSVNAVINGSYLVEAPDQYLEGETVDLILVDSRFRVACALFASKYMREDSRLIIHDFIERWRYHSVFDYFDPVMAPDHRNARRLLQDFPGVKFLREPPEGRHLDLPILGGQTFTFTKVYHHMPPNFIVLKLNAQTLNRVPRGKPIPEYVDYLHNQS